MNGARFQTAPVLNSIAGARACYNGLPRNVISTLRQVQTFMQSQFLVPETTVTEKGTSEPIAIDDSGAKMLLLTLGITNVVEQEALDVSVHGSADGQEWNAKPVCIFPQKFYSGAYSVLLDRAAHPDVKFLRAEWNVQRWGVGSQTPMFRFYVFAEPFSDS